MKPEIVLCVAFPEDQVEIFRRGFEVHYAPTAAALATTLQNAGERIRGAVTTGTYGITGEQIRAMPKLEIVVTRGRRHRKRRSRRGARGGRAGL